MTGGEETRFDWRRGVAAGVALFATLLLLGMVWLVALSNEAREEAQQRERQSYDVMLLARTVDSSIASAEAALGRYVLDEEQATGSIYYADWRLARIQIDQLERLVANDPPQRERVTELKHLFNERGQELAAAARAASAQRGSGGIALFYQAGQSETVRQLAAKLREISSAERQSLSASMQQTQLFSAEAGRLTDYLSWLGVLVALIAIAMGVIAMRTLRQYVDSKKQAEDQFERATGLEAAVAQRTEELEKANAALRAEAEERAAAEAQLRQVQKMEAVGQLTGGIAHDFNNMLAVVVGGLDLARRRIDGPRRELLGHLSNAMDGATRAAALTRRLLSFARSEPLLPERVESANLVESMRDLLDRTLGERIRIRTNLADDAWPVFVDALQLENAILNLAVNARDAMDGKGDLTIRTANMKLAANEVGDIRAGEYLVISVSDTGCGMPKEICERAFEPFFTTKEVGKGTGLGLSQIFGFAHQSGGEVGIESELGKGTTVSIYLPRTEVEHDNVHVHPSAQMASEEEPVFTSARILLVEDDARVRSATVGALEDLGYEPKSCSSAAEALALFEPGSFDLVITDVIMPEMTGPELVRELKARQNDLPILFVTGYVGEGESEDLVGYELLRKPFTVNGLARAVATAIQTSVSHPNGGAAAVN
ncbi:ATP-binding protein [Sphingomicrobium lutaoense]|uniref:histidine kinase n=1 Tax=Sphingomicrobium lutaoense TaxID=515949 RepID=A0A839YXU0_9SPHN|nr:ATP-binding protein [Sphingomicrobium lutaoense]MBB3763128.1 signal transduction histidine kinase/ActR/RegA family two-component response regulator [Sphingomicrobium lutaoense]